VLSRRGILRLALIVLLLIGQQAAFMHALHHLANPAGSKSQQRDKTTGTDSALCAFHGTCAEILGAVASAVSPLRLAANLFEQVVRRDAPQFVPTPVTVHSRSPPVFL
jgi:hypothetical protein